jgi:hypothetical protein
MLQQWKNIVLDRRNLSWARASGVLDRTNQTLNQAELPGTPATTLQELKAKVRAEYTRDPRRFLDRTRRMRRHLLETIRNIQEDLERANVVERQQLFYWSSPNFHRVIEQKWESNFVRIYPAASRE